MIKILMICNLWLPVKSRKLEELAEQIRGERAKHEAKGKQVGSSREGQNENTNQDQTKMVIPTIGGVAEKDKTKIQIKIKTKMVIPTIVRELMHQ
jgi:ribosome assembly protein YihI (activator of Der GTPase)